MPRLDRWALIAETDGYTAPECVQMRLRGFVFGHPDYQDGHLIVTSEVVDCDVEKLLGVSTVLVLTRSGTSYALGEPDPRYEEQFPHAATRVLNAVRLRNEAKIVEAKERDEEHLRNGGTIVYSCDPDSSDVRKEYKP